MRFPALDGLPPRIEVRDGKPAFSFDPELMIRVLGEERYASAMHSPTLRLPFSYLLLPGAVRLWAAKGVYLPQRWLRAKRDPSWPVAPALDLLLELVGRRERPAWGGSRWALSITHDVDTVAGLRRAPLLAEAVERAGFRSCFYIVGEAANCEPGLVRELAGRGHEIGSHDVIHDNRLCFLPPDELDERLRQSREAIEPYGGVGFRSPSLLRSPQLIEAVGRHFAYDSSVCDTDLEYTRGCTTVFPYWLRGCLEIPVTLPMDSSLLYVGYRAEQAIDLWKKKCEYIRGLGGLAVLVTHAEPHLSGNRHGLELLGRFLQWVGAERDCWVLLPRDATRCLTSAPHSSPL